MLNRSRGFIALLSVAVLAVAVLASGCAQNAPAATPTKPAVTPTPAKTAAGHPLLTLEQLSDLQPGLGTVMVEYGNRFANMWFAAQVGNWDMVHYQILEMTEIQEVGETTRPARASALKAFEDGFLKPLDDAAQAKNLATFTTAYDKTITGCNGCHAGQTSADFKGGYKFVKIQRPTTPAFPGVDWKGQ